MPDQEARHRLTPYIDLALLTDLYQLTMMGGFLENGKMEQQAVFDLFFRKVPHDGGFCVAAGLEPAIRYIEGLRFNEDELAWLRGLGLFHEAFIDYLRDFRFRGDVDAVPEGTLVFPNEPLLRVKAPLPEAQLIETALLNLVNFQTLIATKAARICLAAEGGPIMEFGLRRAQGPDGGLTGTRASYIGGCQGTSNVLAAKLYGIPAQGTQAHSWVMSFDSEVEAFRAYARAYPDDSVFLVDTYHTLESGVPAAITVAREMEAAGHRLRAIRLDSGDLAYLSKEARRMLDEAGLDYVRIVASSDLDEWLIQDLKIQGARIDSWGVGTRLITSYNAPTLGGVYKLVAASGAQGKLVPRIKLSSNPEKVTTPGVKQVWRIYDEHGTMQGDLLALEEESFEPSKPVRTRHPGHYYERRRFSSPARMEPLLVPVFRGGKNVYTCPPLDEVRQRTIDSLGGLRPEHKRLYNADIYWVGLSEKLFDLREHLIEQAAEKTPLVQES